uniref:Transposase-associated domain-containing protein n=1 Tax=Setaria italica TaxID=4555 RepID=K4A0C3_SETIT
MYGTRRHSHTFMSEVSKFVEAAEIKQIRYLCFDCSNNIIWEDTYIIKRYFINRGGTFNNTNIDTGSDKVGGDDANENDHFMMDDDYDRGDQNSDKKDARVEPQVDEECDVDMVDMLCHIELEVLLASDKGLENFETLKKAAKDRMYEGCRKEWTVLRFVLHLLILKAKFSWSDNSFNDFLTLLGKLLPKPNLVPKNTYEAKKIINPLKMRVQKIHACRNHCILYRDEYANCDASRYKSNADFYKDCASSSIGNKTKKGAKKSAGAQLEDESWY